MAVMFFFIYLQIKFTVKKCQIMTLDIFFTATNFIKTPNKVTFATSQFNSFYWLSL